MVQTKLVVIEQRIAAFWKNDGDAGFMMEMKIPTEDARGFMDAMRGLYAAARWLLQNDPVRGKALLLRQIEEFAAQYNRDGRPNYTGKEPGPDRRAEAIDIMMQIAALERLGLIESDEYNGIVVSAAIEEHVLQ